MEYQVLARKWRPRDFLSLVGQTHVRLALEHALMQQRLHHAYLFSGTHGVGKTTIARILAKCLNCETGITATPCLTCETCVAIEQGRCPDVLEIDAASRTKVEDTRDLLSQVIYAPVHCRYKIYIIDEVHMLSTHSFNALLKTLEEPPAHVIFLLATTDPERLPLTVLSRCLQFNLKKINQSDLTQHLAHVLQEESIPFDSEALQHIADQAQGSLRDALSLLDQAINYGGGEVRTTQVHELLGTIAVTPLLDLLEHIAQSDADALMKSLENIAAYNPNYGQVINNLLQLLHTIHVQQILPNSDSATDGFEIERIKALSKKFNQAVVQLYYQILLLGQRDLAFAQDAAQLFQMLMLRLFTFNPNSQSNMLIREPVAHVSVAQTTSESSTSASSTIQTNVAPKETKATWPIVSEQAWCVLRNELTLNGLTATLANHCKFKQCNPTQLELFLEKKHAAFLTKLQEKQLAETIKEYLGQEIQVKIILAANDTMPAGDSSETNKNDNSASDPYLAALMQTFNAKIISS